ncbi:30S ribosomal protein S4 [soil metagenome]
MSKPSIVKQSRREGYALHPKALKAMVKRSSLPGMQGGRNQRGKSSQYSLQLREKQKVKRIYGLLERQFENLMAEANRTEGQSGQTLLKFLEQRLDNAVYRAGFAPSRPAARQLVTHGHFMLNGRRVDIPSIRVKIGDEIVARAHSASNSYFQRLDEVSPVVDISLSWLKVNRKKLSLTVTGIPTREEAEPEIKEQLIVEYYSR